MKSRVLTCLISFVALLIVHHPLSAQTAGERGKGRGGEGESHLVLTYACKPEHRVAFRVFMETEGVNQFEQWKRAGVMKSYLILFSTFVNQQLEDMWVILDFEKFVDIANWQKIERNFPGGLSPEGLALATPKTCVYSDLAWSGGTPSADRSKSVFMLIPYVVLANAEVYDDFVTSYILPQLQRWVNSGIMPSYQIHLDQNPTNAPWSSLLVFEYDGLRGIALRDAIKQSVRDLDLKEDAGYKKYSPIKRTIRTELQPTTFVAILPKK